VLLVTYKGIPTQEMNRRQVDYIISPVNWRESKIILMYSRLTQTATGELHQQTWHAIHLLVFMRDAFGVLDDRTDWYMCCTGAAVSALVQHCRMKGNILELVWTRTQYNSNQLNININDKKVVMQMVMSSCIQIKIRKPVRKILYLN